VKAEFSERQVFIDTQIFGDHYWFMLDSGSGFSILSDTIVTPKNAESLQTPVLSFGGGLQFHPTADLVFKATLATWKATTVHQIDGIIGDELFRKFVVQIDYDRTVLFCKIGTYPPGPSGLAVKVKHRETLVPSLVSLETVPVSLETVPASIRAENGELLDVELLIDTGDQEAVGLFSPTKLEQPGIRSDHVIMAHAYGSTGRVQVPLMRVKDLTVSKFILHRPIAHILPDRPVVRPVADGPLGGEFWRRFTVTFDYSQDRILLRPNQHYKEAERYNNPGFFGKSDANKRQITVSSVVPQSPADRAGVQQGDELIAIDGKTVSNMTDSEFTGTGYWHDLGKSIHLTLRRAGNLIEVDVKMKQWF
jgi:hypothetical protein